MSNLNTASGSMLQLNSVRDTISDKRQYVTCLAQNGLILFKVKGSICKISLKSKGSMFQSLKMVE